MTTDEAVAALDALDVGDCERAHASADNILLMVVPHEVREAFDRVVIRSDWWAFA